MRYLGALAFALSGVAWVAYFVIQSNVISTNPNNPQSDIGLFLLVVLVMLGGLVCSALTGILGIGYSMYTRTSSVANALGAMAVFSSGILFLVVLSAFL